MAIFSSSVLFAEQRREQDQVAFRGGGGGGGGRGFGGEHQNFQNRENWDHNQNWEHHNWNNGYYNGGYYEGGVLINPVVPEVNPYYEGETPDQIYQNEIYQQNTPG